MGASGGIRSEYWRPIISEIVSSLGILLTMCCSPVLDSLNSARKSSEVINVQPFRPSPVPILPSCDNIAAICIATHWARNNEVQSRLIHWRILPPRPNETGLAMESISLTNAIQPDRVFESSSFSANAICNDATLHRAPKSMTRMNKALLRKTKNLP